MEISVGIHLAVVITLFILVTVTIYIFLYEEKPSFIEFFSKLKNCPFILIPVACAVSFPAVIIYYVPRCIWDLVKLASVFLYNGVKKVYNMLVKLPPVKKTIDCLSSIGKFLVSTPNDYSVKIKRK